MSSQDGTFKCQYFYYHYYLVCIQFALFHSLFSKRDFIIVVIFQENRLNFMSFWKACLNSSLNEV